MVPHVSYENVIDESGEVGVDPIACDFVNVLWSISESGITLWRDVTMQMSNRV